MKLKKTDLQKFLPILQKIDYILSSDQTYRLFFKLDSIDYDTVTQGYSSNQKPDGLSIGVASLAVMGEYRLAYATKFTMIKFDLAEYLKITKQVRLTQEEKELLIDKDFSCYLVKASDVIFSDIGLVI